MADDFFLPAHWSKYISLSAQLTVIREETEAEEGGGNQEGQG